MDDMSVDAIAAPPAPSSDQGAAPQFDAGGPEALSLACAVHGVSSDPGEMRRKFASPQGFGRAEMIRAASDLGLKAKAVSPPAERLAKLPLPAIARDRSGRFLVLARIAGEGEQARVLIQRPGAPPEALPLADF